MLITVAAVLLLASGGMRAGAQTQVPYDTYNYDYWGNLVYTPAPYVPAGKLSGESLGIGAFSAPQDMFLAGDTLYVADTGNNRIVMLGKDGKLKGIIDSLGAREGEESLKSPKGICVTADGTVYVADSGNKRVVVLDSDGNLLSQVRDPKSDVLPKQFEFVPSKVVVDYAGRVYVIADNMYQGIMCFSEKGEFTGFTGTINVTLSPYEIFWLRFSTKEQRSRQKLYIATEFTGMDIDGDGFIYATNIDNDGRQSVRLLNPKGQDVIGKKDSVPLSGDLQWRLAGDYGGASRIVDVTERGKGIYSILDYTRGRIFTYDAEGNCLYIFGGMGTQAGTFQTPTALEAWDDRILVLDAGRNEILLFQETRYGQLINEATGLRYDGDETQAVERWKEVLKYNSDFELAYSGIGKATLAAGNNREAMHYLRLAMDKEYYSIAYKRFRNEILERFLPVAFTLGLGLIAARAAWRVIRKRRMQKGGGA